MKKFIYVILALVSMFSFFMLFSETEINNINNIKNVEKTLHNSYHIVIPNSVTNKNIADVYKTLKDTLDKYNGNIYYSRAEEVISDGKAIDKEIKYVYFNNLDYFNSLFLSEGRIFELNEKESDLFLSTEETNDDKQIGQLACFSKNTIMEIYPLSNLITTGLFDGYCYVQFASDINIDDFLYDMNTNLNVEGIKVVSDDNYEEFSHYYKWIVILGLYFLCMTLIIYNILRSYKKLAIKKMLGFSTINIYGKLLSKLLLIQISMQFIVTVALCLIKFDNYNIYVNIFLTDLIKIYFIEILLLLISVTIPCIYINKIKIPNMLKNKQPTKEMLIFNFFMKIIIVISFFIISNFIIQDFNSFKNIYSKSFLKWEQMSDYVVLPTLTDTAEDFSDYMASKKSLEEQREIYTYFNKKGAVLADFGEFMPRTRSIRLQETDYPYESDKVRVNPNYLKLNPIYDIDNQIVNISEEEEKEIILVPEKYKQYENNIIEKHKWWNEHTRNTFVNNREISIIWIKDGQSLFSYNLDVNPDNNNYVTDSFINVLTENNGGGSEYAIVMAYKGNPFKIKIDPNLSLDENIRPELEKYGYSQYISKISKVNEMIAADSNKIKEKMYLYFSTALLVGVAAIFVLIQNVFNFFTQYKSYLAIRHLQGYGIIEKYKEYFILILSSWCIISAIIYTFKLLDLHLQIKLSLVLILFEFILSIIVLILNDRKNIISVIKGR